MKNKILNLFVFFIVNLYYTQSLPNTENYIYSRTYLEAVTSESTTAKQLQNVVYFDGLGRPKQKISIKSTSSKDLVVPITYDSYGRQSKSVLPVPVTTLNGNIQNISETDANSYYNVSNAYSESVFDDSPLNRIIKSAFPGDDWEKSKNHTVDYEYDINLASDSIKKYTATTVWNITKEIYTSTLNTPSLYSNGELYKYKITDENRNINEIYQNAFGQTVMIRKKDGTNNIDTYYVYDNSDNIAFIITPKAVPINISTNPSALDDLCYQYNYDEWGRLAEKKLPGKAWEYLAYDKYNRLVATSIKNDAKGRWLVSKFDWKGRVAYTALFSGGDRVTLQSSLNNSTATEYESSQPTAINGLSFKYTNQSFPTSYITQLLTVYNYDFYPSDAPVITSPILGQNLLTDDAENNNISTLGMPTASYVKNIGEDKWTKNYIWYDTKGRAVVNHRQNHLGGYTKNETKLDFAGFPLESITKHKRLSTDAAEVIISERFVYDSSYRLKNHFHKVGNQNEVLLSNLTYDDIGQLSSNAVGDALQTINYTYNIRGWLKSINDPNNLNGDLFGLNLRYNEAVQEEYPSSAYSTEKVVPKYNGNISEVEWKTAYATNEPLRRYSYIYDGLDRLKAAYYNDYSNPKKDEFFEKLTYDLNGNINTLKRSAKYNTTASYVIDDLAYTYTGNQLKKIVDATNNNSGYLTYDPTNPEMTYDENGNMTSQMSKRISTINYNFLDLPTYATTTGKGAYNLTFVYRADGVKVSKSYKSGISAANVTEYLDGFQYYNNVLQFVPTSEGYYDFVNNRHVYQYKDQVGNVRLSYYKDTNNLPKIDKETNYYPFGLEHTYNGGVSANRNYKYTFQGQEKQEMGWLSFKWRNYDPTIGRFFNIDPLSEKYAYQSHYNFSENRVIDAFELEGLESEEVKDHVDKVGDIYTDSSGVEWQGIFDGLDGVKIVMTQTRDIEEVILKGKKNKSETPDLAMDENEGFGWGDAGRTALNFLPIVGSGLDIYDGIKSGNMVQLGIGIAGLAIDIGTLGTGSLAKGAVKTMAEEGLELALKEGAKELAEGGGELAVKEGVEFAAKTSTRFITTAEGVTIDLQPTLNRIASGGKFPHKNDGSIFKNFTPKGQTNPLLPVKPQGYYREFVHPTPGANGPGAMRIVTGQGGEMWFTPDHYKSFIPIR